MRANQIEEQLSNTLKAIDKLTADIEAFKKYTIENNKVVNGLLRKIDDQGERMDKALERMERDSRKWELEFDRERKQRILELTKEQKARQKELDAQNKRFEKALDEDRRLRLQEIAIMNKRLEMLEAQRG